MGMFVNPDNSAFQVALNSEIYVDKTGMLEYTNKVINTLQGYICNSRPRRFGKEGEERQSDFLNIVAWGKLGEYMKKRIIL